MNSRLHVQVSLSHPYLPATLYMEEPLYALLDIEPGSAPGGARSPLNVILVVDSSGTMHDFHLTDSDREYWLGLAISRDEIMHGQADQHEAIYWSGQTLSELQAAAHTPMGLVVEAVKNLMTGLQPDDKIAVIAFADRVHTVVSPQDWATFPNQCPAQLDLLRDHQLPVDIGTGTYLADALEAAGQTAAQMRAQSPGSVNRLIVISDGLVQDKDAALTQVQTILEQSLAITTLGVGDHFDEEFLIQIADSSRGQYHYAADTYEITARLTEEMTILQTISVTDLYTAVHGVNGTLVQDMALVRPSISLFEEMHVEGGWTRARVGDISSETPIAILIQLAPATHPEGSAPVAEINLAWAETGIGAAPGNDRAEIKATFTDNPDRLAETNADVQDIVERFSVYRLEREAQRAQERGDLEVAREKLGAATRRLRHIGEDALAADFDEQIASLGDPAADPTRVKRIKATTRRLGSKPPTAP